MVFSKCNEDNLQLGYSWLILDYMYDFNKKWESSFNVMHNDKFLVFMYFD
jgi:hypothetical protein